MNNINKYNLGDEVWRMSGFPESPEKVVIVGVRFGYSDDYDEYMGKQRVFYTIDCSAIEHEEEELFPTKEELLNSL